MPKTIYASNRRGGHCPGHVRETFLQAVEAFVPWDDGTPEPTVEFEVGYEPRPISISKACRLVWNCSDILPGDARTLLEDAELVEPMRSWTYASAARAMYARILERKFGIKK
jgi:hypothetical protein